MGYDKLISFFSKNLPNVCIKELFVNNDTEGNIVSNHIFFDISFIIYTCINIIEKEINNIIKIIFSLPYTDNDIINDKLKNILYQKHWKKINLDISDTLDGNNQEEIIKKLINFLNATDDINKISNINKLLYWNILFKLEFMIKKIHVEEYIKSINIFFDGIPSYSKILEQRRRRMKNYLDSQNRKKLFNKFFENIIETIIVEDELIYDYFSWLKHQFSFNKSQKYLFDSFNNFLFLPLIIIFVPKLGGL